MGSKKNIPFDSLVLAAVMAEAQQLVGGKLQRVVQATESSLTLGIYANGREIYFFISCSPRFARAHLSRTRPKSEGASPPLAAAMRHHVEGSGIGSISQRGFDRILEIEFVKHDETFRLIGELTGKHSNLVFVGPNENVLGVAHTVSSKQSIRPLHLGRHYEYPPFPPRPAVYEARSFEELKESEGASPFFLSLLNVKSNASWPIAQDFLSEIREKVRTGTFAPVRSEGFGVYPISVAPLGYAEERVTSISAALENHFASLETSTRLDELRARLLASLKRVLLAREVALEDLRQAADAAKNANRLQTMGELILAYASRIEEGQSSLETQDYEGNVVRIELDPELSPVESAQKLFDKAKKAKSRAEHVADQSKRLNDDYVQVLGTLRKIEDAKSLEDLHDLEARAKEKRWLHEQRAPLKPFEEKPYEGHRIRERLGPGGVKFLFGENATSNDYLTHRVAKPNDIWLHVRGSASAHVIIQTGNKPERISKAALLFGAKLAVQNSPSKHSSYVPVDYTLKKYVRKARGSGAGTATYTHEKTLHVDGG